MNQITKTAGTKLEHTFCFRCNRLIRSHEDDVLLSREDTGEQRFYCMGCASVARSIAIENYQVCGFTHRRVPREIYGEDELLCELESTELLFRMRDLMDEYFDLILEAGEPLRLGRTPHCRHCL